MLVKFSFSPIAIIFSVFALASCKKFVQIDPPKNQVISSSVYSSDATAISVMRGIYSQMFNSQGFVSGAAQSITVLSGFAADELNINQTNPNSIEFYSNSLSRTNNTVFNIWQEAYKYINNANAVIEGLTGSSQVSLSTKIELTGEAKFIRAFCYFYLVNLFGDIPLVTTTDYQQNAMAARTPSSQIYQQMVLDLNSAQNALSQDYSFSNGEKDQPNKNAATALLARVNLYMGNWSGADSAATAVISNTNQYRLSSNLDSIFLANSQEAIWQLKPLEGTNFNTNEGSFFILSQTSNNGSLNPSILNSFEPGDNRRTHWIDSINDNGSIFYFPYKYKVAISTSLIEYSMILRLAEQYLIRAEAKAQQSDVIGSLADLNAIRNRAGLPNTFANNKSALLTAILQERKVELFTEWGHRWLDLKRTGSVDSVMAVVTPQKGNQWKTTQQLFPIPQVEIINDNKLTQNPGY